MTIFNIFAIHNGVLAQLVQSAALTGQRSLVRTQYIPLFLPSLMTIKQKILQQSISLVGGKIAVAKKEMEAAQASANEETKSSAGDKYETGRAMSQNERDMHARKLSQLLEMKNALVNIDGNKRYESGQIGALVETNSMSYLIATGLGIIQVDDMSIAVISGASPMGQVLLNKKVGETLNVQGKKQTIQSIV